MRLRLPAGEVLLGVVLAGTGAFWIVNALRLPLWDGFAPAAGLLPLIYGGLLVLLAVAALLADFASGADADAERSPPGRAVLILATLAAGVAGVELIGFAASMLLVMLFLFRIVERQPLARSLIVATTTALLLTVIFRGWLGVPLPVGPWGY